MKKFTIFVLFCFLFVAGVAEALTINVPGRSVEVNESVGGASVKVNGLDTSVDTTVSPGEVKINANGSTLNVSNGPDNLNVEVNGQKIKINSNSDLENYKNMVLEGCSSLQDINTEGDVVEVRYNQPARFFGIFKTSLNAKVSINEAGKVEVKLPWYRFLFTKNAGDIESQIQAKVSSNSDVSVGVGRKALLVNLVNDNLSLNVAPCKVSVKNTNDVNLDTNVNANANANTNTNNAYATVVANFSGEWNGTYTASALASGDCSSGGKVSLSIDKNGGVLGYATVEGIQAPGTGTVDGGGNLKGKWNLGGIALSFAGKLNATTGRGTGSYQNKLGCSGSFSVSR